MPAATSTAELDIFTIVVGLAGGLSLFLFGMIQLADALKAAAGRGMRAIIGKLTKNRFTGAITGVFVTALVQSSSVTTVLIVGFVSAGLMTLQQTVGVIMGANIGSTFTAQIIAFKVTKYALILVSFGFATLFVAKRERIRHLGSMVMGLGMIFFGMSLMSDATNPLRSYEPFIDVMKSMDNPLWSLLGGAVFTALIQSSAATTGIVIVLASQGFITLEAGIALALGANIGTCVTAFLASIGKPRVAMQASIVHIIFNIVGAAIWVGLIWVLADVARWLSPTSPGLSGAERLAAETPRQIANAHTIFNVVNTLALIPFAVPIAWIAKRMAPEKPVEIPEAVKPRYLDGAYLRTPTLAVDQIRREIGHLGSHVNELVLTVFKTFEHEDMAKVRHKIRPLANNVNVLYQHILDYARQLMASSLDETDTDNLQRLLRAADPLQSVSDTVVGNIMAIREEVTRRHLPVSEVTAQMFNDLRDFVCKAIAESSRCVAESDREGAEAVVRLKSTISRQADALMHRISERLTSNEPDRVEVYRTEAQAVEILKRLYYFAKRVARTVIQEADEPSQAEDDENETNGEQS
ncbi:MAG: Na/Pi cotransporter family protein [Planctomycetota bacterium]|jgi:phosphate:Na+ symporter